MHRTTAPRTRLIGSPSPASLALFVALAVLAALPTSGQAPSAPFRFSGPLPSLLAPGAKAAPNASGLPFEVKISGDGKTVTGTEVDLAVPGADKPLHLSLTRAAYAGGKLTATAILRNGSTSSLQGLRLDLGDAVETYSLKDAEGKVKTLKRPQTPSGVPLHFGDLGSGEASDPLPLSAGGLALAPETAEVAVKGFVSGLRYETVLHDPEGCGGNQIDADASGTLYLADVCGQRIARLPPAGAASALVTLPDQAKGSAREAKSGRLAATYMNDAEIHLYGADGKAAGTIGEAQGVDTYPDALRFDPQGRLWGTLGASLARFAPSGKVEVRWRTAGGTDLGSSLRFDVAADGTVWVLSDGVLWRISADGKTGTKVASPGARPGELAAPQSVRVAADGSAWVTEGADSNLGSAERISVFDSQGRLVRLFGRGAQVPLPEFPDLYHEAQLYLGVDLAFGPEGRVYVSGTRPGENGEHVMVFRRF